ncbi:MAG: response regulator [Pseudomonadales bacterium]
MSIHCHYPSPLFVVPVSVVSIIATIVALIALLLPLSTQSGELMVTNQLQKHLLDGQLDYLYDDAQIYHIGQISASDSALPWQSGGWQVDKTLLMKSGLYWFRGQLINAQSTPIALTLQVKHPSINTADLYIINEQGDIDPVYTHAGMDDRFDNRPVPHRNLVNSITLPANSTLTLIWRIHSEPLFQFQAVLWKPSLFVEREQHYQMLYGMIYGILLVMTLYNLFLYFSTGEKSYFFYVVYVLSFAYLLAADQGHVYQYVATDEAWAKLPIYVFAYAVNILMFGQFSIYFLNLQKRNRRLLWVIRSLAVISSLSLIAVVISNSLILVFFSLFSITLMYIAALLAGIIVRRAGVVSAGHFIIAIMILVFSLIATNMATLGLINSDGATESLPAIGTTVMLIFFSLALADRINQLQKENNQASLSMAKADKEKLKARSELLKSQLERIQLEQIASEARLESRSKSEFLATLSHEIRTPMNKVLGMTELMKATQLDEQQTHYLNTIEHSGQSLLVIINDLQDFAKIEAGKMDLDIASFNLETLLDDCISTFALRAVEKNLNFLADLDPSIKPVLRGDATKLQQIILNLLSNAFKFTDHGDILLRVRATEKLGINSVELKFEVEDCGIGLTQDEQQRLFSPFQHADGSTYGRYGGSGLGLSISKQLAELMDGDIGVSSTAGKGSCFWFTARLLIDDNPEPSLLREKSSTLASQHLLLVDPNDVTADIITRLLKSWQMEIIHSNNTENAIERINNADQQGKPFTVILCEYNLGKSDGLTLAKRIRQETKNTAPLVLMVATRHLKNQAEFEASGMKILLEKPITTALLHDVLQRAIDDPHQAELVEIEDDSSTNRHLNVLVVEDNQVNQLVIQGLLKQLNIVPDLAANGLQALSCYDKKNYDLILMDCEMPEMDGYEASAQIRSKEAKSARKRVTIIALSAHARSDYQQRALQAGMDNYLTKPIALSNLLTAIKGIDVPC